jgi:Lrp/AsnC family transcriptional regulator for asnA, asnC and gidA
MNAKYVPDQFDLNIIALLNQDGRMPSTTIAKKIEGITSRTVNNRIKALVKHGLINIRGVVNPSAFGYPVMADVYIQVEPGQVREVAEIVAEYSEATYVACATGESDVSVSIRVSTIEELFNFVNDQIGRIPGVLRTRSYILPIKLKDLDTWLPPEVLNEYNKHENKTKKSTDED